MYIRTLFKEWAGNSEISFKLYRSTDIHQERQNAADIHVMLPDKCSGSVPILIFSDILKCFIRQVIHGPRCLALMDRGWC